MLGNDPHGATGVGIAGGGDVGHVDGMGNVGWPVALLLEFDDGEEHPPFAPIKATIKRGAATAAMIRRAFTGNPRSSPRNRHPGRDRP